MALVIGKAFKVTTTSSVDEVQGALEIVHLKVYVLPLVPVKEELIWLELPNDPPVPDTILHAPVPKEGVLAAKVTWVSPHVAELV